MYEAIKNNDLQFIKSHSDKINERYKVGNRLHTCLTDAIEFDRMDIFNYIISRESTDVNLLAKGKRHPVIIAALCRNKEALRILVRHPDSVTFYKDRLGYDAFYYVMQKQDIEIAEEIANFIDINRPYSKGNTALHFAANNLWDRSCYFLLSRFEIMPNLYNAEEKNALHTYLEHKENMNLDILKLFAEKTNIKKKDKQGRNCFSIVSEYENEDFKNKTLNILTGRYEQ